MKSKIRGLFVAVGISAICMITALISPLSSASAAGGGQVVKGGTISIPQGSWATLDPGVTISQLSVAPLYGMIFGHLFFQDTNGKITPDLALRYQSAANGKSGKLFLRPGVKFSDGTPLNAAAVVWNFKRYESKTAPGPCPCIAQLSPVASVTAKGQNEVDFTFSQPYYNFQMFLAQAQFTYMASPTAFKKMGATQFGIKPVGAGPFTVQNDNVGVTMTLVKNPNYWHTGEPYLNQVKVTAISDQSALYTGVKSGTLAFASFSPWASPNYVKQSKGDPNLVVHQGPQLSNMFMQVNVHRAPFNNIKAREALFEATNPAPIVKALIAGGSVAHLLNPPAAQYFPGNKPTEGTFKYNLADAKKLVQEVGGMTFSVIPASTDQNTVAIEAALQQQWQAAGMHVTINNVSHSVQVQEQATGAFQAHLAQFGTYIDPFLTVEPFVAHGTTNNAFGFTSPKLDALLAKIQATKASDTAAIKEDWRQIATIENSQAGIVPLFFGRTTQVLNKHLHGVKFAGQQTYYETAWWGQ